MQSFPTVLIPFDGLCADSVESRLDAMGNPAGEPIKQALDELGIVHFMSLSVVRDAGPSGTVLVLEASVDGDACTALKRIASNPELEQELRGVLRAAGVGAAAPDLAAFLIEHDRSVSPGWLAQALGLCFAGTPSMTVERIRQEEELARCVSGMDKVLARDDGALCKLNRVREVLWSAGDTKWAFTAEPVPWLDAGKRLKARNALRVAATVGKTLAGPLLPAVLVWVLLGWRASLAFSVAALLALGAALARLRNLERRDVSDDAAPDAERVRKAMDRENHGRQNLLVSVTDLKPGSLRRLALRAAFFVIGTMAAEEFRPGFLGDIGTIHFARWVLLPGTRKLVFLSNYDGSLESYLEDFIQRAHQGLTAIWSNTQGFPRARWLFLDGARDGDRFRRFVLRSQVPARFWYSAYPSLTTARIRANAAIRYGIAAAATDDEAEAWLACFGASSKATPAQRSARPRAAVLNLFERLLGEAPSAPRFPLEDAKIPTLVFGARKRLRYAACLMIKMKDDDPAACQAWVAGLEPEVTYGAEKHRKRALVLAFAHSAFRAGRLELSPEDLATFSPPFLNGMDAPCRARALGNYGDNAPECWAWGGEANPVDALVIAYDENEEGLNRRLEELKADVCANGHRVVYHLRLAPQPALGEKLFEPFGFLDGVSQPLIRGAGGAHAKDSEDASQEAGEFVLGYCDNSGYLPPTPTVAAEHDPGALLGASACGRSGRRDLGRNGTYLAVQQLAQDTQEFSAWLSQAACQVKGSDTSLASVPACVMGELIAAKLVGRWRNGSALAHHPASPGSHERNDFLYGSVDPSGLGCPLGAHARRANPRDSLDPGSDQQLTVSDRHRLLRVGRKYKASEDEELPGLLFMCLNADLGRQFEFVQQTWLLGRSFHGLEDEDDPMIGQGRPGVARRFTVHTQQGPMRLDLPNGFVKVRGGGYFFMPGLDALRFLARRAEPHRGRRREASPGRAVGSVRQGGGISGGAEVVISQAAWDVAWVSSGSISPSISGGSSSAMGSTCM